MSWKTYVDTNLIGSGKVRKAAIIGLDGNMWADGKSGLTDPERKKIASYFTKAGIDGNLAIQGGVTIGGVRFLCLKQDPRSIYGKKGQDGVVVVKTNKCILIGIYDKDQTPGNATACVEGVADYLISQNS